MLGLIGVDLWGGGIGGGGIWYMMSFDSTTKSMHFLGVMEPKIFSLNDAHAGSRVIPGVTVFQLPLSGM